MSTSLRASTARSRPTSIERRSKEAGWFGCSSAAIKATAAVLGGRGLEDVRAWLQLLLAFDVIFLAVGTLTFPAILEE